MGSITAAPRADTCRRFWCCFFLWRLHSLAVCTFVVPARCIPALRLLALLLITTTICGCDSSRKRPVGYFHLGEAAQLAAEKEHLFEDLRILVRYDEEGFSAMSTECPYDGVVLARVREGNASIWRSPTSGSVYDGKGKVVKGPSTHNLPFYELRLDRDSYEGRVPTLYVHVGVEREEGWRLKY